MPQGAVEMGPSLRQGRLRSQRRPTLVVPSLRSFIQGTWIASLLTTRVWKLVRSEKLMLLLSLHVDDTLVTGSDQDIDILHGELQKRFGPMKAERHSFKHFGVHVSKLENHHVVMSQENYLSRSSETCVHRPSSWQRPLLGQRRFRTRDLRLPFTHEWHSMGRPD